MTFRLCLLLVAPALIRLAAAAPADAPVSAYVQRANKIVATLALNDAAKTVRVHDAITAHYRTVNLIDDGVASRVKALKQSSAGEKAAFEKAIKSVHDDAEPKLAAAHAAFITALAADLTPAEIDQVKDGLTYGILPRTVRVYREMLPDLTTEQVAQILAWLSEARERAMDAGSAAEKHGWFGKAKGKINNYLAKAGYDMKAAEKNLAKKS